VSGGALLLVGSDGTVVVYADLPHAPRCAIRASAAPLLSGEATRGGDVTRGDGVVKVHSALLIDSPDESGDVTRGGEGSGGASPSAHTPLLVLSSGAYVYQPQLQARDAMRPRCGREAAEIAPRYSRDTAEMRTCASQAWASLSDVSYSGSSYFSSILRPPRDARARPLAAAQHRAISAGADGAGGGAAAAMRLASLAGERQRSLTIDHVEHQATTTVATKTTTTGNRQQHSSSSPSSTAVAARQQQEQ